MVEAIKNTNVQTLESIFDNLISLEELTSKLKGIYKRQTIYNYVYSKDFPHHRIRGRLYFLYSEVLLWIERSSKWQ